MSFKPAVFVAIASVAVLLAISIGAAAPKQGKPLDTLWLHPEFAKFGVDRIAVMPIATFDNSFEAEQTVDQAFGQAFRGSGYRWMSAGSMRDLLRGRANGSDSLVKLFRGKLLKSDHLDSLDARALCGWAHTSAVMSLRVDQWERQQIEWNQAGKPFTQVQVRAALMDSAGRLLWSAAGSNKGEGSYNDPNNPSVAGVTTSGLDTKPISAQAGAPSYAEVVLPLFKRWADVFPPKRAAGDSSATTPK